MSEYEAHQTKTLAETIARAESLGLRVEQPNANQLFLDIDSEEDYVFFQNQVEMLRSFGFELVYHATFSKSGSPHRHVRASIIGRDSLTEDERNRLQAILGSDRRRELYTWIKMNKGWNPAPTVFFEPK